MTHKHSGSRKLRFQALESRQMMAGDLVAYFPTPGDLAFISGTAGNESLVIAASRGGYTLTGLNGTTINGASQIAFRTISNDLTIDMGAGNDKLVISNVNVAKNLFIGTAGGNDSINLQNVNVGADVGIDADLGTGPFGNDSLTISNLNVVKNLFVGMASGNDSIVLKNVNAGADVGIDGDNGTGPAGNDSLVISNVNVAKNLFVGMGGGNDAAWIQNVKAGIDVVVEGDDSSGSDGMDVVALVKVQTGNNCVVNTGGNKDYAALVQVKAKNIINANTGLGDDDTLLVFQCKAQSGELYDGEEGGGTLISLRNRFNSTTIVGFDTIFS